MSNIFILGPEEYSPLVVVLAKEGFETSIPSLITLQNTTKSPGRCVLILTADSKINEEQLDQLVKATAHEDFHYKTIVLQKKLAELTKEDRKEVLDIIKETSTKFFEITTKKALVKLNNNSKLTLSEKEINRLKEVLSVFKPEKIIVTLKDNSVLEI